MSAACGIKCRGPKHHTLFTRKDGDPASSSATTARGRQALLYAFETGRLTSRAPKADGSGAPEFPVTPQTDGKHVCPSVPEPIDRQAPS